MVEKKNSFTLEGIKLLKNGRQHFKPGRDSIILVKETEIRGSPFIFEGGCGSGFISIYLAKKFNCKVVGVDVFDDVLELARENSVLNGVEGLVDFKKVNIKQVHKFFRGSSFDLFVSNPPYIPAGEGRMSPAFRKSAAKHEILMDLEDLSKASSYLLKPNGKVAIVYPSNRIAELIVSFQKFKFYPQKLIFIKPSSEVASDIMFLLLRRNVKGKVKCFVDCKVVK